MTLAEDILNGAPSSVPALLAWRVSETPDTEAFLYPDENETWQPLTWRAVQARAHELAAGLLSLGLGREHRVAIVSSTRIEWILADLAIGCAGGATTTIYPNTATEDFAHIVRHSGSRILIVEDDSQVDKVKGSPGLLDAVDHIVVIEGDGSSDKVLPWSALVEAGKAKLAAEPRCVTDVIAGIGLDSLATLIYTSGTTGLPKGVELVHRSWVYQGLAVRRLNAITADDLQYLWLPLSHVFGKDLIPIQLAIGFCTAVDGRVDKIMAGLQATKPTFMCGAPRIYEKVRNAVTTAQPRSGLKGRFVRGAFRVGKQSVPYRLEGLRMPLSLAVQYFAAQHLVFGKLRQLMGGRIRFFVSGSAKLSAQVQEWFYSAGMVIVEGYGLTETTAVSFFNVPDLPRFGTVGPALVGTDAKLADDGEVLVKGPAVMRGYHDDPERTAEVLDDGWFHTGDIGTFDSDGYLRITDRKKDLMKTSGGKYVAPQKVESALAANVPYVSQAIAVGDGRKYIAALLTLDRDNVAKWAARHNKADRTYQELTQDPELRSTLDKLVARANKHLERWETVKKYAVLDHEITVDDGGVTPNMKLRRATIVAQHKDIVDSLFDHDEGDETQ